MAILDVLNRKIDELKNNSPTELESLNKNLDTVKEALEALDDDEKLISYDFNMAINLVNRNVKTFGIIDFKKCINDVKNVLIIRNKFVNSLTLSDNQSHDINCFKEKLIELKKYLEELIIDYEKGKVNENLISNLDSFKELLEGDGTFSYEMLESFFEVVDYDTLSYKDIKELSDLILEAKTRKIEDKKRVKVKEVISLLQEYYGPNFKTSGVINYRDEICSRIDLDNARKILEFFRKEKILKDFFYTAILQIVVYGKYEFIKDFYFEKVLPKKDKIKKLYFNDTMSCLWINENSSRRRYSNYIKTSNDKKRECTLYSTIADVSDDDFWENVRLINENNEILCDKFDVGNIDNLWVLTKPTWLIKKNLELFKLFGFSKVKISAIAQNDVEEKLHLTTELGLLNPPRNSIFNEIEEIVPRYEEFEAIGKKRKKDNGSILNYYERNATQISSTSFREYIYWFYKIQRSSKEEFYQCFFSKKKAGTRATSGLMSIDDEMIVSSSESMNDLIKDNFIVDYTPLINRYDVYKQTLDEFYNSEKSDDFDKYYDESILSDVVLESIERFKVKDEVFIDGRKRITDNPYVYVFDKTIISRYKVLHNLTVLKDKFAYIDEDMLLSAIVYNSYMNLETFEMISERIRKDGLEIWTI